MKLPSHFGGRHGFTLIEIIIVLAILVVLGALLAPTVFEAITASKEDQTRRQAEQIFTAIMGDPAQGKFGYLGDMGRLPDQLSELVSSGTQTAFHTCDGSPTCVDHIGRIGWGWRGPYLGGPHASEDLLKDAWGQAFEYTSSTAFVDATNPNRAGQIISKGPDGQSEGNPAVTSLAKNADNIIFPNRPDNLTASLSPVGPTGAASASGTTVTGTLLVTVIVNDIPMPVGLTVKVYSANGTGEQGTAVTQTTPNPSDGKPFRFTVPHGVSAVEVTHLQSGVTVTRTITVPVAAGTQVSRTVIMKTSATVVM